MHATTATGGMHATAVVCAHLRPHSPAYTHPSGSNAGSLLPLARASFRGLAVSRRCNRKLLHRAQAKSSDIHAASPPHTPPHKSERSRADASAPARGLSVARAVPRESAFAAAASAEASLVPQLRGSSKGKKINIELLEEAVLAVELKFEDRDMAGAEAGPSMSGGSAIDGPPLDNMVEISNNWISAAGGGFGFSQRIVLTVLGLLAVGGGVEAYNLGSAAAHSWWDQTNLIQRCAPLYMVSLLPYLDFLWKMSQSKPQATNSMVFAFAFVLVFVVISTPVEMFSRLQLGKDVADVDPLHFAVQGLITLTNFFIIVAFKKQIDRVSAQKAQRETDAISSSETDGTGR